MSTNNLLSKALVYQKLKLILTDIKRLEIMLEQKSYEQLATDEAASSLAERRLERVINRAIDINLHLLRSVGAPPPTDYTRSFLDLATVHILTPELAQAIAPCVGTRNILVHEYDDLNTMQFFSSLQDAVRLFPQYAQNIEHSIKTPFNSPTSS